MREGYMSIRKINNGYQARSRIAEDANGTIMVQEDKVLEIWRSYFYELLNREDPVNPIEGRHMMAPETEIDEPTMIE